ncbi:hypothetical protein HZS_4420 [Henneguya salminicola]|nr:hypothetical protein HZS_4420 [Henneguya salminicola]
MCCLEDVNHSYVDIGTEQSPANITKRRLLIDDEYVPCVYYPLSFCEDYLDCNLLHKLILLLEYQRTPLCILVDFEIGLI